MADWSQLPKELLDLIAQRLGTPSDILRFRAVCSAWRSSVDPKSRRLPNRFRILPGDGISSTSWGFYLSKRTIFRLTFPEHPQENPSTSIPKSWLIKIEEDVPDRMHLLNPLSSFIFSPLPTSFPRTLDSLNFRVWELGQEYVLQYINYRPMANSLGDASTLYMEKVVFCPIENGFAILTIHVSGKLAIFRSGDTKWTISEHMPPPFDDVILYKNKFYAVDHTGRTVHVQLNSNLNLIANSVFGGDKKYLVESHGEMLLVDMYLSIDTDEGQDDGVGEEFYNPFDAYVSERIVRFKVYELNEEQKKWIEVKNLGDRVLFLGENSTFSTSASAFSGCSGNCIYFNDSLFCSSREEDGPFNFKDCGIGVFDLENGNIGPLTDYSGYSKVLWPPPSWVASTLMEVQNHVGDLSL